MSDSETVKGKDADGKTARRSSPGSEAANYLNRLYKKQLADLEEFNRKTTERLRREKRLEQSKTERGSSNP